MSRMRDGLAALVAVLMTAALVALSGWDAEPPGSQAVLRLSWRARSPRVQQCRRLTPEEIAAMPAHMRRTEECEGKVLPYDLRVVLNGRPLLRRTVHGGGARQDRPVYVFNELTVPPGRARLEVSFIREEGSVQPEHSAAVDATPARLTLVQEVELKADQVLLVTYDADRGALVSRAPAQD